MHQNYCVARSLAVGIIVGILANAALGAATNRYVDPAGGHVWPFDTWGKAATNLLEGVAAASISLTAEWRPIA